MSTVTILRHLATHGSATAAEIGRSLKLLPGSVRGGLSQLETRRHVQSHKPAGGDRVFTVTAEGRAHVAGMERAGRYADHMVAITQGLGLRD